MTSLATSSALWAGSLPGVDTGGADVGGVGFSDLPVSGVTLITFLLILARTTAWAVTAPIIRSVSGIARLAVAVALAVFFTPLVAHPSAPDGALALTGLILAQAAMGLALGFLTSLLLNAVEAAGALVDFQSGFSMGALFDPVSGAQAAVFARLANVTFVAILFATDAHHAVVEGFARTFVVMPVDSAPRLAGNSLAIVAHSVTTMVVAAIEIAAPLLGVLFLTEIVLAITARLAPQTNPLALGLTLKAMLALTLGGLLLTAIPTHMAGLLDPAVRLGGQVIR